MADHYAKLGFAKIDEDELGVSRWELKIENAQPTTVPMKIVSEGFGTLIGNADGADAH